MAEHDAEDPETPGETDSTPPPETPPPLPPGPPSPPPPPGDGASGAAWERPGPFLDRIVNTVRDVLLKPTAFFRGMRRSGDVGQPLFFLLITGTVAALFWWGYNVLFQMAAGPREDLFLGPAIMTIGLILAPAIIVLATFITAGIYHLVLVLLGAARAPYEATFRVVAYSSGSTSLIGIIPICGGLIGAVWQIVACIIGLAEVHETSTGYAAVAVIVPFTLCCCAILALVGLFVGFGVLGALAALGRGY
jgi:hypothetical protein